MTEKDKTYKNSFISHIPATMDEVLKTLLQPNYDKVRGINKQKQNSKKSRGNTTKVKK